MLGGGGRLRRGHERRRSPHPGLALRSPHPTAPVPRPPRQSSRSRGPGSRTRDRRPGCLLGAPDLGTRCPGHRRSASPSGGPARARRPGGVPRARRAAPLGPRVCPWRPARIGTFSTAGRHIQRLSDSCAGCRYEPGRAAGDRVRPFTTPHRDFLRRHHVRFGNHPRAGMQWRNLARLDAPSLGQVRARAEWPRAPPSSA
jgi:hypothetical protein